MLRVRGTTARHLLIEESKLWRAGISPKGVAGNNLVFDQNNRKLLASGCFLW